VGNQQRQKELLLSNGQVIVLGMHRSGTSCVGNLLTKMGLYFGDPSISTGAGEENRKGFFERRDIRDICDAILQGSGCDWWAVGDFSPERVPTLIRTEINAKFATVLQEMDNHKPWFIKEPRLCLVWPLLSAQVADPVFVHVWRDPLEVARSLATRNGFPIDFGTALWEAYVRSAQLVSSDHPSVIVSYNNLLKDPTGETRRLIEKLTELGVSGIAMPQEADLADAIDAELYRQREVSSPELNELITPSQRQLCVALGEGNPKHPSLFQPLSRASQLRLEDWTRREGAVLALRTRALQGKQGQTEAARLKTEIVKRVAELKKEVAKRDGTIETLNAELAELKKEVAKRDENLEALNAELAGEIRRSTLVSLHDGMSAAKAFFAGTRALLRAKQSSLGFRWALYLHYLIARRRKDAGNLARLAASGFFDPVYYLRHNRNVTDGDPLIHFVDVGAAQGRNPSSSFNTGYYLQQYPDVANSNINPLLHFISYGRSEGRHPLPPPANKDILGSRTPLPPLPSQRIVVYSAVVSGYDNLKPPGVRPPNCDFVAFSDQPLQVDGWEVRPLNYLHHDPTRAARFVKLHPHIYFPEYDYSIWVDANIGIRGDIRSFISRLANEEFIGIFEHPLRNCIYVEAEECIKRKKDHEQVIRRHADRYRAEGFPEKAGLWETNIVVRRHNDPACKKLMTAWWRELEIGSRRDQISLPVVASRLSVEIAPLGQPGENARDHPHVTLVKHLSKRTPAPEDTLPAVTRKSIDIDQISIDIGVCVHNSPNEVQACLTSLLAARRPQDGIVIVDDASDAPTAMLLDEFATTNERVTLIRHKENQGYTQSANDVLSKTQSDWVVLLNSDTVVPPRALRKLIVCGEQFSHIGIVGPLSNAASWQTVPQMLGPDGKFLVNEIPAPLTVEDMDRLCEELSTGAVPFVPLVNGFCYAVRRSLIKDIGYFDEARFPTGYGEEDDYCLRAGAAGYVCSIATDAYVYHVKSASFTSERRKPLAAAGSKALQKKHSAQRVSAATEVMRHQAELARIRRLMLERLSREAVPATRDLALLE
jgi:O-antigen biosynthesis protein